jgi:hypothetical protein
VNKAAVLDLPQDMGLFFYIHSDFLVEESTVPDLRKYTLGDKLEAGRHYIDLESYNYTTPAAMPQTMQEVIAKYGADSAQRYGILPWYIETMMDKLTKAFKDKKKTEILFLAADLGHYLADAHMPLHTSINHDGQYTDQKGIHAFWESELPEMFGDAYNLHAAKAEYINDIPKATWDIIQHSHMLADTLLLTEKKLKGSYDKDKIYAKDADGKTVKNRYGQAEHSKEYAAKYHELLKGMVERQLQLAINATASFWYTAWVNAGKPDLSTFDSPKMKDRFEVFYREDEKAWEGGKVINLKADAEY